MNLSDQQAVDTLIRLLSLRKLVYTPETQQCREEHMFNKKERKKIKEQIKQLLNLENNNETK